MNIRFEKIASTIERDIAQLARNQIVIDKLKRPTRKDKFMLAVHRINWLLIAGIVFSILVWSALITAVRAAEPPSQSSGAPSCPNPGEKCKIIYLSEQEERMLMTQNGILDTAAQARALDLGQFAVYLKTRIGSASQGEVKPVEQPKKLVPDPVPSTDKPVDNM